MSPDARARAEGGRARLGAEMDLAELRRAMRLSQEEIAAVLNISQGAVAKMEKRADMLVGTLRRFIEAMGGKLEIVARFPDRSVRIETFGSLSGEIPMPNACAPDQPASTRSAPPAPSSAAAPGAC